MSWKFLEEDGDPPYRLGATVSFSPTDVNGEPSDLVVGRVQGGFKQGDKWLLDVRRDDGTSVVAGAQFMMEIIRGSGNRSVVAGRSERRGSRDERTHRSVNRPLLPRGRGTTR